MRVGSIFIWKEFNQQADERIKDRLFIYLGRSPAFIDPIYAYIATTTSKIENYKNGERFSNNNIIWFKKGDCNFNRDCVLDLDRNFFSEVELNKIVGKKIIGIIPENKLRNIYEKIKNNNKIGIQIRINIYDSFNRDKIFGLKKPK
ncbi:MAG: hypothetical protein IMZ51_02655 [Chloroflexi bacterium]|nr:hypothetical protein [Chloroflexota bacterium]